MASYGEKITDFGISISISEIDSETTTYSFSFPISKNYINFTFNKIKYECYMEDFNIDTNNIKIFCIILRHSIDFLESKGCKKLLQLVNCDDWNEYLLHDKWEITNSFQNIDAKKYYHIQCNIEDALYNIGKGLGLNLIET